MLVTTKFEEQRQPLRPVDLAAWHWCLVETQAVGLFNSDTLAGASQRHRHMQLVPRASLTVSYGSEVRP